MESNRKNYEYFQLGIELGVFSLPGCGGNCSICWPICRRKLQYPEIRDVSRPLCYKTTTTYFFKTKTTFSRPRPLFQDQARFFLKTIKLLTQDLKKRTLTENIRPVMLVLPGHAGITPVTEKNAYYRLSSQVLLHPKLEC